MRTKKGKRCRSSYGKSRPKGGKTQAAKSKTE
ncbi:MAG: hypothetical protein JW828_03050 [Sedimentisphaerales bacterium]|nr:hypothetical protein [Sedimentisphaerales bacterium]